MSGTDDDIETLNGALAAWDTCMMTWSEYVGYFEAKAEMKAEREAEGAYERYLDYQAWLRDGWQPEHAFKTAESADGPGPRNAPTPRLKSRGTLYNFQGEQPQ